MTTNEAKRRLAAILSADVVGYSRLMADDDRATLSSLKEHRASIGRLVEAHDGRVVNAPGDALLAEFPSALEALQAAVEIQTDTEGRNAQLDQQRRMRFRIGLSLGDVLVEDDGTIYGDGVNIAARMEALADAGGICLSSTVYDHVKGKLAVAFDDLGPQQVKNFAESVRAYRVMPAGAASPAKCLQRTPIKRHVMTTTAVVVVLALGGIALWQAMRGAAPDTSAEKPRSHVAEADVASVKRMVHPLPAEPSIAVLPFDNLSGDPGHDFIADGLSENIISTLSQVRGMLVIARNSVFTYKGKAVKVQQVAEDLGVKYVLEGSVQVADDQVRVTAQLIDALTGQHMLSERYDRRLDDIFAMQDELTFNVVTALQVELTEGRQAITWRGGTEDLEAWSLFQRGLVIHRRYTKGDNARSRALFRKAVARDPDFALAWTYLGWCDWTETRYGWTADPARELSSARTFGEKALEADPDFTYANSMLAFVTVSQDGEFQRGLAQMAKVADDHPNMAVATGDFGYLLARAGESAQAIEVMKRAMRQSPYYPAWYSITLASAYIDIGDYSKAFQFVQEYSERSPDSPTRFYWPVMAYAGLGREVDVAQALKRGLAGDPEFSVQKYREFEGQFPVAPAVMDGQLTLLRKAGVPERPGGVAQARGLKLNGSEPFTQ